MKMTAFMGAHKKGYQAYERGVSRADCPYNDTRTYRGCTTFSRGFIRAWLFGWDEAQSNQIHGDYDGWYMERY